MKYSKLFIMAAMISVLMGCAQKEQTNDKQPITKPQITLTGDRLTPEALWAMGRIGSVKSDIETGLIAYTVSYYSVEENRSTSWIRICNPFEAESQEPRAESGIQVVDEFVGAEPAWFGSSGWLAYMKGGKLYLRRDNDEIEVQGADEIEGFLFSPMRDKVILIKTVKTVPSTVDKYPDLPLASGRVVDDLLYKHWDEWVESAPQPFVYELELEWYGEGERIKSAKLGGCVNLLEGTQFECPMRPFGGIEQLAWAPDNKTIAYTCRKKTGLDYAISTNSNIYLYNLETKETRNITEGNDGYDTNPAFSPDGLFIAWQSMARDGYESDQNRLMVMNLETGKKTFLSKSFDSNVDEFAWFDNQTIVFTGCWHATVQLYSIDLQGTIRVLTQGQYDHVLGDVCDDRIYLLRHSMVEANEVYCLQVARGESGEPQNKSWRQLTFENKNIYDQLEPATVVPRWQKTTDGKDMLTWIILPPHFDANKKYPTLLYCEGGPQSPVSLCDRCPEPSRFAGIRHGVERADQR